MRPAGGGKTLYISSVKNLEMFNRPPHESQCFDWSVYSSSSSSRAVVFTGAGISVERAEGERERERANDRH